ncbi:MAG: transposase [Calditrichaeota bacterium]|nr:transposase [Candidatus Cloacimonadota bacterium]MCB1046648.1 transposase [Calditrichota bacterium]
MPNKRRILAPDTVYHITQRGNNRVAVFHTDQDRAVYLSYAAEYLERSTVKLHAYCLMGNHVHLLLSASDPEDIPELLCALQSRYARYFNLSWHRSGSLWQRRYRSIPVESDSHLISCFLYIDMNPVKSRLVTRPDEYAWSSYRALALGESRDILTLHQCYTNLGSTSKGRCRQYRSRMDEFLANWRSIAGLN